MKADQCCSSKLISGGVQVASAHVLPIGLLLRQLASIRVSDSPV
jgi:hypothetical protein